MMTPRLPRRRLVPWSFAVAAVIGSCNLHNPGLSLPPDELSYPNALALSPGASPSFLYVANTNFDLRYNAASVHSYNLASLDRELAARRCRSVANWPASDGGTRQVVDNTRLTRALDASVPLDAGQDAGASVGDAGAPADAGGDVDADAGTLLDAGSGLIELPDDFDTAELGTPQGTVCTGGNDPAQGDCCFDTAEERNLIREDSLPIDSYGVGLGASPDGKRLYVPLSSRNQLTYIDVDNGKLSCAGTKGLCRRGPRLHGFDEVPDDSFPGTFSTIAVGKLSDLITDPTQPADANTATYIVATHELGGYSLMIDRTGTSDPVLESVGHNLPERPRSIVADPAHHLLYVASADTNNGVVTALARIGVRVDPDADVRAGELREPGPRELLYQTSAVVVSGVSQPSDTRDLAIDPRHPDRIYALVRGAQESIAFLQLDPTVLGTGTRLIDAVRVGAGPSKIKFIQIGDRPFLLVSCYDAKAIYIVDPDTRRLVSVVRSLSGPFEMLFDESRKLLHVTDFRASVLRVVDLEGLVDQTKPPPRIVATIGMPRFKGVK